MSYEAWHKGHQEVRNVIHNEIGITKDEIIEVFRQIARDEIKDIVSENRALIYETIQKVIRQEMWYAIQEKKFPKIGGGLWNYTVESRFQDYITDIMKEEILDVLRKQFELNFYINKKEII